MQIYGEWQQAGVQIAGHLEAVVSMPQHISSILRHSTAVLLTCCFEWLSCSCESCRANLRPDTVACSLLSSVLGIMGSSRSCDIGVD